MEAFQHEGCSKWRSLMVPGLHRLSEEESETVSISGKRKGGGR